MRAPRVSVGREVLADPRNGLWRSIPSEEIPLEGTPLGSVPSNFIKVTIPPDQVEVVRRLTVAALHNGREVAFRLEWEDESEDLAMSGDGAVFPDGCGVAFPLRGDAPIKDMGSRAEPINAWHWRADFVEPQAITAAGLGTSERVARPRLFSGAVYDGGRWAVCLGRALDVPEAPEAAIALAVGRPVKVGFAIWAGHKQQRGPIKTYSGRWRDLVLEA